jgi:putative transposase
MMPTDKKTPIKSKNDKPTVRQYAYKFRCYPTEEQEAIFNQYVGCCRALWNDLLAEQKRRLDYNKALKEHPEEGKEPLPLLKDNGSKKNKIPSFYEYMNQKIVPERPYLEEVSSVVRKVVCRDLDKALKQAFDKNNVKKIPRFKKKADAKVSFQYYQAKDFKLDFQHQRIHLPKGVGWVKFKQHYKPAYFEKQSCRLPFDQVIPKSATFSKHAGNWYVSIQVEEKEPRTVQHPNQHPEQYAVGVDVGVKRLVALSTGELWEGNDSYRKNLGRLKRLQCQLARQLTTLRQRADIPLEGKLTKEQAERFRDAIKNAKNYQKTVQKVQKWHAKVANIRKDYTHNASCQLTNQYSLVILEDLKTKNMTKSAKGTAEALGKRVAQKRGLNKAILDQGFYELRRQIEYKAQWKGGKAEAVNPAYTSQTCSACGYVSQENRKSQAVFICETCGHTENADINAAKNILTKGLDALSANKV